MTDADIQYNVERELGENEKPSPHQTPLIAANNDVTSQSKNDVTTEPNNYDTTEPNNYITTQSDKYVTRDSNIYVTTESNNFVMTEAGEEEDWQLPWLPPQKSLSYSWFRN